MTQWVKWPHCTDWHPQNVESPQRIMRTSENSHSHSWWWDSHISPNYSRWLVENLREMDSKIKEMLNIIEEEADSFAKRAEMYYKRRPELLNLVEDFYRSYRALAERYHFLSGELHQNLPPAFRDQYGLSTEPLKSSPAGIHKKKWLDQLDPFTFCSVQSFAGESQNDKDVEGNVSKSELPDPCTEIDIWHAKSESPAEISQHRKTTDNRYEESKDVELSISYLYDKLQQLGGKSKIKEVASTNADCVMDHDLELCELHKKINILEAQDKKTRNRLQIAIELEHRLEAENSKLNHAITTLEQEKTEMDQLHKQHMEAYKGTTKRVKESEELLYFSQESHKTRFEGAEELQRLEEEGLKMQNALIILQEEKMEREFELKRRQEDLEVIKHQLEDLQVKFSDIYAENGRLEDELATETAHVKLLQKQLVEWKVSQTALEGEMPMKGMGEELSNMVTQVSQVTEVKGRGLDQNKFQLQKNFRDMEGRTLDATVHNKLENELQLSRKDLVFLHGATSQMDQQRNLREELYHLQEEQLGLEVDRQKLQNIFIALQDMETRSVGLQKTHEQLQVAEHHSEELQKKLSGLEVENLRLKGESISHTVHGEILKETLFECKNSKNYLEGELHAKEEMEEEFRNKLRLETEQVQKLKVQISQLEQSLRDLQPMDFRIRELEKEIAQPHRENNVLEEKNVNGDPHIKKLKNELFVKEEMEEKLRLEKEQVQKMGVEIQMLNQSIQDLHLVEMKIKELEGETVQQQGQNEALEQQILVRDALIKNLETELQESEEMREGIHDDVTLQQAQVQRVQDDVSHLKVENLMLYSELVAGSVYLKRAKEEVSLQEGRKLLENELSKQTMALSNLNDVRCKLHKENEELTNILYDVTNKIQQQEGILNLQKLLIGLQEKTINFLRKSTRMIEICDCVEECWKQLKGDIICMQEKNNQGMMETSSAGVTQMKKENGIAQQQEKKHDLGIEQKEATVLQENAVKPTGEEMQNAIEAAVTKMQELGKEICSLQQVRIDLQQETKTSAEYYYRTAECPNTGQEKLNQVNGNFLSTKSQNERREIGLDCEDEEKKLLEREISCLQERKGDLRREILAAMNELNSVWEEMNRLHGEKKPYIMMKVIEDQVQDMVRQIEILQKIILQAGDENKYLRNQLSESKKDCETSRKRVIELQEHLTLLQIISSQHKEEFPEQVACRQKLNEEICRLQKDNIILLEDNALQAKKLQNLYKVHTLQEQGLRTHLYEEEDQEEFIKLEVQKMQQSLLSSEQNSAEVKEEMEWDIEEYTSIHREGTEFKDEFSCPCERKGTLKTHTGTSAPTFAHWEEISSSQRKRVSLKELNEEINYRLQSDLSTLADEKALFIERHKTKDIVMLNPLKQQVEDADMQNKLHDECNRLQRENGRLKEDSHWQAAELQAKCGQIQWTKMQLRKLHEKMFGMSKEESDLNYENQGTFNTNLWHGHPRVDVKEEFMNIKEEEKRLAVNKQFKASSIVQPEAELSTLVDESNILTDISSLVVKESNVMENIVQEKLSHIDQQNTGSPSTVSAGMTLVSWLNTTAFSIKEEAIGENKSAQENLLSKCKEEIVSSHEQNEMLKSDFAEISRNHSTIETKLKSLQECASLLHEENNRLKGELAAAFTEMRSRKQVECVSEMEGRTCSDFLILDEKTKLMNNKEVRDMKTQNHGWRILNLGEKGVLEREQWQKKIGDYERHLVEMQRQLCNLHEENGHPKTKALDRINNVELLAESVSSLENGITACDGDMTSQVDKITRIQEESQRVCEEHCLPCPQLEDRLNRLQELETGMEKLRLILLSLHKEVQAIPDDRQLMDSRQYRGKVKEYEHLGKPIACLEGKAIAVNHAKFHANLGERLHQEYVGDELKVDVLLLQEEHKKSIARLQVGKEQAHILTAKLEKVRESLLSLEDENSEAKIANGEQQRPIERFLFEKNLIGLQHEIILLHEKNRRLEHVLDAEAKDVKRVAAEVSILVDEACAMSVHSWEKKSRYLKTRILRLRQQSEKYLSNLQAMGKQAEIMQAAIQKTQQQKPGPNMEVSKCSSQRKNYRSQSFKESRWSNRGQSLGGFPWLSPGVTVDGKTRVNGRLSADDVSQRPSLPDLIRRAPPVQIGTSCWSCV